MLVCSVRLPGSLSAVARQVNSSILLVGSCYLGATY